MIKYPFWWMTESNPRAVYVSINRGEAVCPDGIAGRALCMNEDIGKVLCDCAEGKSMTLTNAGN